MRYRKLDHDPRKLSETVVAQPNILPESGKAFQESTLSGDARFLLPRIEAVHEGRTRNGNRYPADKLMGSRELMSGVYSWLHPYAKPVIYNHDTNTEATGRIQTATFSEYTSAGRPGIIVVPKITEEKAVQSLLDGRLLTVSIGATTDAAICSICGTDIINDGFCGHYRGESYDDQTAEWIVGNVWFDELSWVNVPADQDAMVIDKGSTIMTAESFASNGREILNLGKKTTEWLVKPEVAIQEGLQDKSTTEKGDNTLTEEQIKQLQEELANLKKELETVKEEKETAVSEKEALVTEKEELETKLADATAKAEEATATVEEKEGELNSVKEEHDALKAEKETLETELAEEKQAHATTVEENSNLSAAMHKMMVERVVDLRMSLGKETNREEAVSTYATRTTESINDSLQDLLKEAATNPVQRMATPEIQNPGSNVDANLAEQKTKTTLSPEQVLRNLFGGPSAK